MRLRPRWVGGTTLSVHWGSRMASGEVAIGEEDRSLSSIQLASDSAMGEGEKGKEGGEVKEPGLFMTPKHSFVDMNYK